MKKIVKKVKRLFTKFYNLLKDKVKDIPWGKVLIVIFLVGLSYYALTMQNLEFWKIIALEALYIGAVYLLTRDISKTTVIIVLIFAITFSTSKMKENVWTVEIYSIPEKFVQEKNIGKEDLEGDIVSRVNHIRDITIKNSKKTILESNGYSDKDTGSKSSSTGLVSGSLSNNPNSEVNIKIQDTGISLNAFLTSLKRNKWGEKFFGYKVAIARGELIWREEEKKWFLTFDYADEDNCRREEIIWDDEALAKFSELMMKYHDPIIALDYYNSDKSNDELIKICDELINKNIEVAKAYFYKGEALYRQYKYKEALAYYDKAIEKNKKDIDNLKNTNIELDNKKIESLKEENMNFYISRGWNLYELNRLDDSLTSFKEVIDFIKNNYYLPNLDKDFSEEQKRLLSFKYYALRGISYVLGKKGKFGEVSDFGLDKDSSLSVLKEAITYQPILGEDGDYWLFHLKGYVLADLGPDRYNEAIESYEKAIAIKPDYASAYNNIGVMREDIYTDDKNNLKEALRYFNKALEFDPDDDTYYRNKKRVLSKLGRQEEIKETVEKLKNSETKFKTVSEWKNLGEKYEILDRADLALIIYDKAIKLYPDNASLYNLKGNVLDDDDKKNNEALVAYNKAIELDPNNKSYRADKGGILNSKGLYDDAIDSFDDAIFIESNYARSYYNKGIVFENQEKNEEAEKFYRKAVELAPSDNDYYEGLADFLKEIGKKENILDKKEGAIDAYKESARLFREDRDSQYQVGYNIYDLELSDRYEEAIDYLNRAIALDPEYLNAYVYKELLLEKLGKIEDIKNVYDEAIIKVEKKDMFFYRTNSRIADYVGDDDWKEDIYNRVQEMTPKDEEDYYDRGIIFKDLEEYKRALRDVDKSIFLGGKKDSDEYKSNKYSAKGSIQHELGDYVRALESYEKSIALDNENKYAYNGKCGVLIEKGEYQNALDSCNKAILIDKFFPYAYLSRGIAYKYRDYYRDEDLALNDFYKTLDIKQGFYEAMYQKARILVKKEGRVEEALENLRAAVDINDEVKDWMKDEEDFDVIRSNEEFKKIIE